MKSVYPAGGDTTLVAVQDHPFWQMIRTMVLLEVQSYKKASPVRVHALLATPVK